MSNFANYLAQVEDHAFPEIAMSRFSGWLSAGHCFIFPCARTPLTVVYLGGIPLTPRDMARVMIMKVTGIPIDMPRFTVPEANQDLLDAIRKHAPSSLGNAMNDAIATARKGLAPQHSHKVAMETLCAEFAALVRAAEDNPILLSA